MAAIRQISDKQVMLGFGKVLRRLRQERGLTQQALADASNTHRMFVSYLETGRQSCTLPKLYELAAALDLPAGAIIAALDAEIAEGDQ